MEIRRIPSKEYVRQRWKNSFGWTREILCWPESPENWDWRLSIAEVDQGGPFSAFQGCDRELVLLSGNGMRLCFDDGETVALLPPHDKHRFSGERALSAELIDGPTQDFNLIWRRDRIDAQLLHRPLVGAMMFFREPGVVWVIHLIAGQAWFNDREPGGVLEQGDSAMLTPATGEPHRVVLDGGGEVLLIRLTHRETA